MDNTISTKVQLANLSCQACQKMTEKKFSTIEGVIGVSVDLPSSQAEITSNRPLTLEEIQQSLAGTHYQAVKLLE